MAQDILRCPTRLSIGTVTIQHLYQRLVLFSSDEFQMTNFAGDCSPYNFSLSINDVIHTLEWYKCNYLKPNPDKWQLILSEREPTLLAHAGNKHIFNSNNEKVLGVYFDNKLNFEYHLGKLCKKASQKLHALQGCHLLSVVDKRRLL